MGKGLELVGMTFNRLAVIEASPIPNQQQRYWLCKCSCGKETVVGTRELTKDRTKSCGCLIAEKARATCIARNTSHGESKTQLYILWWAMMSRCYNKNVKAYPRYGGRGITVSEAWHDFAQFKTDMGEKPKGLSLDRLDNNLGYSASNCRWVTYKEQNSNRRDNVFVTLPGGGRVTRTEAARVFKIHPDTLGRKLSAGGYKGATYA